MIKTGLDQSETQVSCAKHFNEGCHQEELYKNDLFTSNDILNQNLRTMFVQ